MRIKAVVYILLIVAGTYFVYQVLVNKKTVTQIISGFKFLPTPANAAK